MKLKNNIYNKFAICAAALSLMACSNIDEDDRLIYVEPVEVSKHVLIEDFTGQYCKNCPNAATVLENLQEQYGADKVIAVAIHSGPFSKDQVTNVPSPLWTENGDYYYNSWKIESQPTGVIDRRTVSDTFTSWGAIVREALQKSSPLELNATTEYDESSHSVTINIDAKGILDVNGKLQVWLVEDSIQNFQVMPDGSFDIFYVHNHVFRTAVNGKDGESFNIKWNEEKNVTFTAMLEKEWVAENMFVVAFVYNSDGVQQTVKVPVLAGMSETSTNK